MVILSNGIYLHCAWASDSSGSDFSLTEFDSAEYVGRYKDHSETESTVPADYSWISIYEDTSESDEDESDDDGAELENRVDAVESGLSDVTADSAVNATAIIGSTDSSDTGLGNVNILSGTNSGADNYTADSGLALTAESGTIYDETETATNYLAVTCTTAGFLYFTSSNLRAVLGAEQDDNTFTFSADFNMSALFTSPVTVANADGTNAQIDFGTIDISSSSDELDTSGGWCHFAATANATGTAADAQVIRFDLSGMAAGATLKIANLKIEYGATDTEWRQSQEEIAATANSALATANTAKNTADSAQITADSAQEQATKTNNYFWYDSDGAHVATESGQGSTGKNVLLTSDGMKIRKDASTLADFSGTGTTIYDNDREIYSAKSATYSETVSGGTITGYQSNITNANAKGGLQMVGGTNSNNENVSILWLNSGGGASSISEMPDQAQAVLHSVTAKDSTLAETHESMVYTIAKKGEGSGIMFQYDKVSGATVLFPLDDLIYTPGDTAYGTSILSSGFITASKKEFRCVVPIPRPLIGISAATVTTCSAIVRQGGGYVLGGAGDAVNCLSGGTVTPIITPFGITLRIVRTTAMEDATNNDTATAVMTLSMTFAEA